MGPRLGSRGKLTGRVDPMTGLSASMGPRLGSRGKFLKPPNLAGLQVRLQWGRDLEVAESDAIRLSPRKIIMLQWGRDLEVAERT